MRKFLVLFLSLILILSLVACGSNIDNSNIEGTKEGAYTSNSPIDATVDEILDNAVKVDYKTINLDGNVATVDGEVIEEFDYTLTVSPNLEGPVYSGTEPTENLDLYIAHDIVYYPEIDSDLYSQEKYDDDTEWVTHYTVEGLTDYLFGTLPVLGSDFPSNMMHSTDEAYNNPVLHITKAGVYKLQGKWNGQIYVDLGEEAFTDETACVTLLLDNADITCTVAPAVLFKNVYEADNAWEDREESTSDINVGDLPVGAKVVVADNSVNNISGSNVYRLLKPTYKNEETTVQKKLYKTDGAFYTCMSMIIDGEENDTGILNITSTTYEGLDSELHLAINGGNINIYSQDDGINVNEDDVSIFVLNGGCLKIFAGLGAEGDGIDSNGYIIINDGEIYAIASPISDNGLDSDKETLINGGTVVALGSNMGGSGYMVYLNGLQEYTNRDGYNPFGDKGFRNEENGDRPQRFENGDNSFIRRPNEEGFNGENGQPPEPPEGFNGERPEMPTEAVNP